ncbi:MAG: hypothetical protein Q4C49_01490 [Bacillota bacterium]|nr:hypothetical protein [Bacillota bacterium]
MNDIVIVETRCGMTPGELTSEGYIPGNIVCQVQFTMNNETLFLSEVEVDGEPNFYLNKKDEFDAMVKEDFDDDVYMDMMEASYIESIGNIDLIDYETMFTDIRNSSTNIAKLVQYIVAVIRMDFEETEMYIQATKGKNVLDITIPKTDIEEDIFG